MESVPFKTHNPRSAPLSKTCNIFIDFHRNLNMIQHHIINKKHHVNIFFMFDKNYDGEICYKLSFKDDS